MIVPLMIWSTRRLIDSQPCTSDAIMPMAIAASSPASRAGVIPNTRMGEAGRAWSTSEVTNQPVNALPSIIPSMPMLTTPERSFMTPHMAPKASGVASARMIVPLVITTWTR